MDLSKHHLIAFGKALIGKRRLKVAVRERRRLRLLRGSLRLLIIPLHRDKIRIHIAGIPHAVIFQAHLVPAAVAPV